MSCVSCGSLPVSSVSTRKSGRIFETMSMITDDSAWKLATTATRAKVSYAQRRSFSGLSSTRISSWARALMRSALQGVATHRNRHARPVAEGLAWLGSRAELDEERSQQSRDLGDWYVGRKHTVEPRAVEIAAQHHVVLAKRGADEADVAKIGPRASVGAAAHAKADAFLGQAKLVEQGGQLAHEARQGTLCFGNRQPAGRDRGAGHRIADG